MRRPSVLYPSYDWDDTTCTYYRRDGLGKPLAVAPASPMAESEKTGHLVGVCVKYDHAERGGWITSRPIDNNEFRKIVTGSTPSARVTHLVNYRMYVSKHRSYSGYEDWIWDPHQSIWCTYEEFTERYLGPNANSHDQRRARAVPFLDPNNPINPNSEAYDGPRSLYSPPLCTTSKENHMGNCSCGRVCGCTGGSTDPFVITRMKLENEISSARGTLERLDNFAAMTEPTGTIRWTRDGKRHFANKNGSGWDVFTNNTFTDAQITWGNLVTKHLICADDVEIADYSAVTATSADPS